MLVGAKIKNNIRIFAASNIDKLYFSFLKISDVWNNYLSSLYPVRIKAVPGPYQVQAYRYGANTRMTRFGYMEGGKIDQETFYSPE